MADFGFFFNTLRWCLGLTLSPQKTGTRIKALYKKKWIINVLFMTTLIVCGNAGVGGTFFLNVLCQKRVFFGHFNTIARYSRWHQSGHWKYLFPFVPLFPSSHISFFPPWKISDLSNWKEPELLSIRKPCRPERTCVMSIHSNQCLWDDWVTWILSSLWVYKAAAVL